MAAGEQSLSGAGLEKCTAATRPAVPWKHCTGPTKKNDARHSGNAWWWVEFASDRTRTVLPRVWDGMLLCRGRRVVVIVTVVIRVAVVVSSS